MTEETPSTLDTAKRAVALLFAAIYIRTHGSTRASGLRVAHLAYRFLNGEDVDLINKEADASNAAREAHEAHKNYVPKPRVPAFPHFKIRKTNRER